MSGNLVLLYLALCFSLLVAVPYLFFRMGKDAEKSAEEVQRIRATNELPEKLDFHYSKTKLQVEAASFSLAAIPLLSFFAFPLLTPAYALGVLVGLLFLPFSAFFVWKAFRALHLLGRAESPVISLSRVGCQFGDVLVAWKNICSIQLTGSRTVYLVIRYLNDDAKGVEKITINLSNVKERHLPEYVAKYSE